MHLKIVGFSLLFLLSTSCKPQEFVSQNNKETLSGTYNITSLNSKDILAKDLTVVIDLKNNKVSGYSGCNSYSGTIQLSEIGNITFNRVFSTKRYCLDKEKNQLEKEFLSTLSKSFTVTITNESIELKSVDNSKRIVLVKS